MIVFCTGGRRPAKKFSSGRSNKIFARDRGFGRRPAHGARRARRRRRGGERGREDAAISKHSRLWYYRFPFNHHIRLRHCCACARVRVLSILFTGYYRNLISFSPPRTSRNSWNYYSLRELSGVSVWRNLELANYVMNKIVTVVQSVAKVSVLYYFGKDLFEVSIEFFEYPSYFIPSYNFGREYFPFFNTSDRAWIFYI